MLHGVGGLVVLAVCVCPLALLSEERESEDRKRKRNGQPEEEHPLSSCLPPAFQMLFHVHSRPAAVLSASEFSIPPLENKPQLRHIEPPTEAKRRRPGFCQREAALFAWTSLPHAPAGGFLRLHFYILPSALLLLHDFPPTLDESLEVLFCPLASIREVLPSRGPPALRCPCQGRKKQTESTRVTRDSLCDFLPQLRLPSPLLPLP
mmetsp:Transcript_15231/g.30883  ORF Transcript_15231/g.30883 Transcript_15231/m.30883 type:complete len:206 (-) Transcript_15231:864-1481(-)